MLRAPASVTQDSASNELTGPASRLVRAINESALMKPAGALGQAGLNLKQAQTTKP